MVGCILRRGAIFLAASLIVSACGTAPPERAASGGGIGMATGAIIGALTGGVSVLAGALIGGTAGAVTGAVTNPDEINPSRAALEYTDRSRASFLRPLGKYQNRMGKPRL